jgi:uncharacterized protein (TIGR02246 family)
MRSSIVTRLAVLAAVATACAPKPPAPPDTAAIRAAIEAQEAKFMPAMAAKDVSAILGVFTEDATWILPDASTFKGRAEIEKGGKGFFDSYEALTPGTMTLDRLIVVSDSEAVTFSTGKFSMTMKGKKPENHTNPFADHWKKGADGVWRIAYEVNAEGVVPAAPPPAAKKG